MNGQHYKLLTDQTGQSSVLSVQEREIRELVVWTLSIHCPQLMCPISKTRSFFIILMLLFSVRLQTWGEG